MHGYDNDKKYNDDDKKYKDDKNYNDNDYDYYKKGNQRRREDCK